MAPESYFSDSLPRPVLGLWQDQGTSKGALKRDKEPGFQARRGGVTAKPRFMDLIIMKEKKDACSAMPRDQDCCPITKNVLALDSEN